MTSPASVPPPPLPPPRPSQRDIARTAGVTQATVSLALNNHPRLSPLLRARIQTIARQLGYTPDPYLSGLSAYRKQRRPAHFHATLAWITNFPAGGRTWRDISTFLHYYEGATARAAELGYQIEEHDLTHPGMTPRRMETILRSRNIPGLLFAPQPHAATRLDDFPLERFASVTLGYTLTSPRLHKVTTHGFHSTETVFHETIARGYRRPGFVMEAEDELRIRRIPSAAFLREQHDLPASCRVPILEAHHLDRDRFLRWFRHYKPDVIITLWDLVYPWLADAGIRVPEDAGLALISVREPDGFFSGMWGNPHLVGSRAVELLIDLVHRNERGIPQTPSNLLVEGIWHEGKTLRPRPTARPRRHKSSPE